MRKYLVEFIGTFFLVLAVGCAVVSGAAGAMAPIAIGAVLMVMVYAGGHISGAHYNPAVTLAAILRGRCSPVEAPWYIAGQLGASAAAAGAVYLLLGRLGTPMVIESSGRVFLAEFLFTFALVYVVLSVATAKGTAGNSFYGLAIGATVAGGAFAVGSISGAVFNPAVALGVVLLKIVDAKDIVVHVSAELAGAAAAAAAFRYLNPGDK